MANETNEERPTPLFRVADEASHPSPTHESWCTRDLRALTWTRRLSLTSERL